MFKDLIASLAMLAFLANPVKQTVDKGKPKRAEHALSQSAESLKLTTYASPYVGETWEGTGSFYGPEEQGRRTASGERFDFHKMTAANRMLPFGTVVEVTNLKNGRAVSVRINDRGPFWKTRIVDLSKAAAAKIHLYDGLAKVRMTVVSLPKPRIGVYTVQVGAFSTEAKRQQCFREMASLEHYNPVKFETPEGLWGRYPRRVVLSFREAKSITTRLRREGFPAYAVRLN